MDISSVLNVVNKGTSESSADKKRFGEDYTQFLRLLTTQLQNQDPLEPMDSNEFTNQLVQFSSVEQQIKSNDLLKNLLTLNAASLTSMGLGYVGMNVETPGNKVAFDGMTAAEISYDMPAGAEKATFGIIDAQGNLVRSVTAQLSEGRHHFTWNGLDNSGLPVPPGVYEIRIGAVNSEGKSLSVDTFIGGMVTGIETADNGNVLLNIGDKKVMMTEVRRASLPGYLYDTDNTGNDTGTDVATDETEENTEDVSE